jgi:hypothetical protein
LVGTGSHRACMNGFVITRAASENVGEMGGPCGFSFWDVFVSELV